MNPYTESIDYLFGASPQPFGQRARDPRGWRWTMPATFEGTPERVPLPPAESQQDTLSRLYQQIDALWEQYYQLADQETQIERGEVEDPDLLSYPLAPPMLPMPAPAEIDRNLVALSSLATMINPLGGGVYMGLPLREQEKRAKTEVERWQALQSAVAQQYRNYVTGIQAINELEMEMWKLKHTKAEDLYRARLQQISSAKQRILDRISQLESTAARIREMAQYHTLMGEASMLRAQTDAERLEAERPLIDARAKQAEASAELAKARADRTRTLTPIEVQLMQERVRNVIASTRRLEAQTRSISAKIMQSFNKAVRSGGSKLSANDVNVRNMVSNFYKIAQQRDSVVREMATKGYDLADEDTRKTIEEAFRYHDEILARIAYNLYVVTGGEVNKFVEIRTQSVATEWEEKAKRAVKEVLSAKQKASVPVIKPQFKTEPVLVLTGAPSPAPPKKEEQKKSAGTPVWQRVWNWLKNVATGKPKQPVQAPFVGRPGQPPPPKPQVAVKVENLEVQKVKKVPTPVKRYRLTVTDKQLDAVQRKPKSTPQIKILEVREK